MGLAFNPRTGEPRCEVAYADRCGVCSQPWMAREGWALLGPTAVQCASCGSKFTLTRRLATALGRA